MTIIAHLLVAGVILLGVPVMVAVCVFALQIAAHALSTPRAAGSAPIAQRRGAAVILVPAHDEAEGIAATLAALQSELGAGDRLLVVADNCSDTTAEIARLSGAEVVERSHVCRGKGFALAFGMEHLRADPPSCVVIVDADCQLAPGSLEALLSELTRTGRPVQALYLMLAPPGGGLGRRLAEFAWRVRNWARPDGWHRLGMPCQLMGTGMAFSWEMLRDAPLANASIVEDMKLGADLALRGTPPLFCARALVTSRFPESAAATRTQRTRWQHGHLETIIREAPRIVVRAIARRDAQLLGFALDLAVPPLALLALALVLVWLLAFISWATLGVGPLLVGIATGLMGVLAGAILLAWRVRGKDIVRFSELLTVPWYIVAKIPMYVQFLVRRQKEWVRTSRK